MSSYVCIASSLFRPLRQPTFFNDLHVQLPMVLHWLVLAIRGSCLAGASVWTLPTAPWTLSMWWLSIDVTNYISSFSKMNRLFKDFDECQFQTIISTKWSNDFAWLPTKASKYIKECIDFVASLAFSLYQTLLNSQYQSISISNGQAELHTYLFCSVLCSLPNQRYQMDRITNPRVTAIYSLHGVAF